ncbi:hypothetical protein D3C86_1558060 [compost metagenome]
MFDCPGADFFWSSGKVALKAKGVVGRVNHLEESGFFDTVALEEFTSIFRAQPLDLFFEFGAHKKCSGWSDKRTQLGFFCFVD